MVDPLHLFGSSSALYSVSVQILKNVKAASEVRNSVCHAAIIFANAIMHSGTTVDLFLRENLDWLSRATNWAKFSATAGLGVIHRGHLSQVLLQTPILLLIATPGVCTGVYYCIVLVATKLVRVLCVARCSDLKKRQNALIFRVSVFIQGRALMAPYLPRNGSSGSPYSEGGALYALGLTFANHGQDVKAFLLQSLRETASEVGAQARAQ